MSKFNASILSAAALLLSGAAFAGAVQPPPVRPLFNAPAQVASSVQRSGVRRKPPASCPPPASRALGTDVAASEMSRADVRQATREAIAHGHRVATGEGA
jgi:hypothetical protein